MGKTGHETDGNRISADHDNRHRACRLLGSEARRSAPGDDRIRRQANQLGGKGGIALGAAIREAVLELQALLFDVAEPTHPVAQPFKRWPRLIGENADATNLRARWALAANGAAITAPPISVMNSRRLTRSPRRRGRARSRVCRGRAPWRS